VAQVADKNAIPIKIRVSGSIILSMGFLLALRLLGPISLFSGPKVMLLLSFF